MESNEVAFDDDEPNTVVAEKPEVDTIITALEILKRKAVDLSARIKDMVITTPEQNTEAEGYLTTFNSYQSDAQKEMDAELEPHKTAQKEIKEKYSAVITSCKENGATVERAIKDWTLEEEKRQEEETRKAQEEADKEKAEAAQTFINNQKAGKETPKETLKTMQAPAPKSKALETTQNDKGTVSKRKVKKWRVFDKDGNEWNKKKRLRLEDVKGRAGPKIPFMMVDPVAIQEAFEAEKELPHWIEIFDDIQITKRKKN